MKGDVGMSGHEKEREQEEIQCILLANKITGNNNHKRTSLAEHLFPIGGTIHWAVHAVLTNTQQNHT